MPAFVNKLTLAGEDYPVSKLTPRQLREVVPIMFGLVGDLGPAFNALANPEASHNDQRFFLSQFTTVQMDNLYRAIVLTVSRSNPNFTMEFFLDTETSAKEIFGAIGTIMEMIGLNDGVPERKAGAPGEADPPSAMPT